MRVIDSSYEAQVGSCQVLEDLRGTATNEVLLPVRSCCASKSLMCLPCSQGQDTLPPTQPSSSLPGLLLPFPSLGFCFPSLVPWFLGPGGLSWSVIPLLLSLTPLVVQCSLPALFILSPSFCLFPL